ncbi:DMT family transporter [Anaerococcus sp. Marseille-Q5996]|uniref:DMT family transporter n=1 Tax=Anaerococcus sp. Marseille-Q5996 TaxID=2972769 RepID=UPI002916169D|nr:DMT family transporter [Anaerococcus sp. Marseille-Q5996]
MLEIFKEKKTAILFTLFAMLLWGSAVPTIKTTYAEMNVSSSDTGAQILIAGIRFFLAGLLGFVYYLTVNKNRVNKKTIDWKYIIILSLIQTFVQYLIYYIGMINTSGIKASIIQAMNSFIVVILSAIMLPSEKINNTTIFAIVLGTFGIVIANGGFGNIGTGFTLLGEGFILIATTFNALSAVYVRKYGANQNEFFVTAAQFVMGSIPLIIIGLMMNKTNLVFTPLAIILLIYGAFISATAYVIWNTVLKYHPAGEMGMYKLFIPIFGSMLSVLILNESFTINLLIGLILVIFGSLILNINKKYIRRKN